MITTSPTVIVDLVVLVGAIIGATAAGLIPYWQVLRTRQAQGLPPVKFDGMFLGTILMAIVAGLASAFMSYNTAIANIDPNATIITVFIVSVITAATSNRALNSLLNVSSTTTTVVALQKQVSELKDELAITKLKVVTLLSPIKKEVESLPVPIEEQAAVTLPPLDEIIPTASDHVEEEVEPNGGHLVV